MVDISMEILASSVRQRPGFMPRYRVKTWWAHIDVPPDVTFIKLPRLPMIQPYLIMTGKDTTIFVESWQDYKYNDHGGSSAGLFIPSQKTEFVGITTCTVDEQLKIPNLNPSVQWLEVHNPVDDTCNGKLLIKIDARFAHINDQVQKTLQTTHPSVPEGTSNNHDVPVKICQSPTRRSIGAVVATCFDGDSSPVTVQSVASRKSDTSVFSIHSVSSSKSQEQSVQTDLSLPTAPMISNQSDIVSRLLSKTAVDSRTNFKNSLEASNQSAFRQVSGKHNADMQSTQPGLDLTKRQLTEEYVSREINCHVSRSEELPSRTRSPQLHRNVFRNTSGPIDRTWRPPTGNIPDNRRPLPFRLPEEFQQKTNNNRTVEDTEVLSLKLNPGESSDVKASRFREVHFDGIVAEQQSSNIFLQRNSTSSCGPQRRRIAAAIFND